MTQQEDLEDHSVKIKLYFSGNIIITHIACQSQLDGFFDFIRNICKFESRQVFTVKWVDEEGDPCTISSQPELEEAIRLYEDNKDSEMTIHVFPAVPERPGLPCAGEDRSVYRRGARRWRKVYLVNGHKYQAKRFGRRAFCTVCSDFIWGLGRQGYRCLNCKILVHKRCHRLVKVACSPQTLRDSLETRYPANGLPVGEHSRRDMNNVIQHLHDSNLHDGNDRAVTPVDGSRPRGGMAGGGVGPDGQPSKHIHLDDFELLRVIGRGSYAKVFQVEFKRTKRIYAMKVIKKELVNDDEDIDWVQTEKHVFEIATNYPFLVGLHSCFQTESRLFFVIEFVNGGDLMFHMQRQRRLPEEHARFYSAEICLALHFLHSRGIVYRDLKLDNVLLDSEGHIKLTDYGMCKEGLQSGDKTSTFCGTPNYIAPEMLRGEEYDFSVDWWALGVLMYEMLAGRSPFHMVENAENPDQQTEDFLFQLILEKPIRIPRSLSVKASAILKGFLNKTPAERLGCHVTTGFDDIKSHQFFKSIDWDSLEEKQVTPPYKPLIQNERDLEYFDPNFTKEPVQLTPDDPKVLENIDQSEFEGFEYINPLLMSVEDSV